MKQKISKGILTVFGLLFAAFLFLLYRSYHGIQINNYQLESSKLTSPVKLVVIGDLHSYDFGKENAELIEKISQQQPDAILMQDKKKADVQVVLKLLEDLRVVAPIYYALGNHELEWKELHGEELQQRLENAGAIVLDQEWQDVQIQGQTIRIGGLYEYAFGFAGRDMTDTSDERVKAYKFLTEFVDTDAFTLMLSHRPDSFIFNEASELWNIDLVASGHLHGGQAVLPFLGGIYGGDQGWFPEYVHGMYQKNNIHLLITSGLSTNKKIVPRWNNPPEIMVLDLVPEGNE